MGLSKHDYLKFKFLTNGLEMGFACRNATFYNDLLHIENYMVVGNDPCHKLKAISWTRNAVNPHPRNF